MSTPQSMLSQAQINSFDTTFTDNLANFGAAIFAVLSIAAIFAVLSINICCTIYYLISLCPRNSDNVHQLGRAAAHNE